MKNTVKKLIALLLTVALLGSITAGAFFAAPEGSKAQTDASPITQAQYAQVDALFLQITALEDRELAKRSAVSETTQDVQKVAALVTASDLYVSDSITWNGDDCFTFMTTTGVACKYSAYLRNKMRAAQACTEKDISENVQTRSYAAKSGTPYGTNVYLIEPYYGLDSSFTTQYQKECTSLAKATGGTYTLYKQSAATVDVIADALEDGAVIVFDSHGDTDYASGDDYTSGATTSYLCLQSGTGLTTADYAGNHAYYAGSNGSMKYYEVDGTAITNHMDHSGSNGLVWMAICLGMATDGLEKPLLAHGLGVVYGYSQSVSFDGDYAYESAFFQQMVAGDTVAAAVSAMKAKLGAWDPAYSQDTYAQAVKEYVAFPIVASDEDIYPGHGKVDTYQTVKSTWTLYGAKYAITVQSSNPDWGTASLSGTTVTAAPNTGYYTASAAVSPAGAATLTQDGNVFRLSNITSDCTVTVEFAAKTPAAITYAVPNGVTQSAASSYLGDTVKLPTPVGKPTADAQDYSFAGWTDGTLEDSTSRPTIYAAGSDYTLTKPAVTLYALYSYKVSASGDVSYRFVDESRDDWSGEYVLTGNGAYALLADGTVNGTALGGSSGAVSFASAGLSVSGQVLSGVTDRYVFEVARVGASDQYTIRMKDAGYYLTCTVNSNGLNTSLSDSSNAAKWTLKYTGTAVQITSVNYTNRQLQFNGQSYFFRCYTGSQLPLGLYATSATITHYTTQPKNQQAHVHDYTAVVTPPTCTEKGYTTYTCSCGDSYVDSYVDALGHAWDSGVVTTPPTATQEGVRTYTCSRCKQTRTEAIAAACDGGAGCPGKAFTDMPPVSNWAHAGIDFVLSHNLFSGTDKTTFSPAMTMSRGMLVTVLWSLDGKTPATASASFSDVPADRYYAQAVAWASEHQLVKGIGNGKFNPNGAVTREQLATILFTYAKYKGYDVSIGENTNILSYADAFTISSYAFPAMQWAVGAGMISGTASPNGSLLDPKGSATRAQVAAILMRFYQNVRKG